MDTRSEDTIVHQIEKSLSNNANENLFQTGRVMEPTKAASKSKVVYDMVEGTNAKDTYEYSYPLVSSDYIERPQGMSRAEYIRQAREACLRQLSNTQVYSRPYEANYLDTTVLETEQEKQKKVKAWRLFPAPSPELEAKGAELNSQQEVASFRSLIIRTVCAIILFLTIFMIDKFKLDIGAFTHNMIEEYVTGKDTFQILEDSVVTWLNK